MAVMRPLPYQDKWSIWPKGGAGDRLPCQLSHVWRDNSKDGSLEERSYRYTKKNIFCPYVPDFLHLPPFSPPFIRAAGRRDGRVGRLLAGIKWRVPADRKFRAGQARSPENSGRMQAASAHPARSERCRCAMERKIPCRPVSAANGFK